MWRGLLGRVFVLWKYEVWIGMGVAGGLLVRR